MNKVYLSVKVVSKYGPKSLKTTLKNINPIKSQTFFKREYCIQVI